jgi:glycosyltransferase involved in cell wall biosynthesis
MTNKLKEKQIIFFLNWVQGWERALTGGDRIWTELAKRWKTKTNLTIIGSEGALKIAEQNYVTGIEKIISSGNIKDKNNLSIFVLFKNTVKRIFLGNIALNKFLKNRRIDFLYSTSDFPADSLPAFFIKIRHPEIIWIAGYYLFVSPPWKADSPYKGKTALRGFVYWLSQIPTLFYIKHFADFVFVTSEPDVKKFITPKRDKNKIIVVRGGVDTSESKKYLRLKKDPIERKKYLACFVGRLHYQKGVLELIDIWKNVVKIKPQAKLAIIGNGPLEKEMKDKIAQLKLEKNIDLLGFKDGKEKYEIFKNSKTVVHPAIYDSGGMAAAEAMAWGLPGISFDLEALKTYYPKGMIKTPCFDLNQFAQNIINLDEDKILYKKISLQAIDLINSQWDWNKRAQDIFEKVFLC